MTAPTVAQINAQALHDRLRDHLPMWVIHERPTDYPEGWVARLWLTLPTPKLTRVALYSTTRDSLEQALPVGLVFLPRTPEDAPAIVGVWL